MKKFEVLSFLLLVALSDATFAQEWKLASTPLSPPAGPSAGNPPGPQQVQMLTEWGKKVTPDNAWQEYPRPQLVREGWQNLNGLWNYAIVPKEAPEPGAWNGKILVPYPVESALSGVGHLLEPNESLWYQRRVQVQNLSPGQRILLHFDGIDFEAKVWVNGKPVGQNKGMNTWWSCDITEALAGNPEATILIKDLDPTDSGAQPLGKQKLKTDTWSYTRVSGIWQTVWMEAVPEHYVTSIVPSPLPTCDGVEVTVEASAPNLPVAVSLSDQGTEVASGQGPVGQPIRLTVKNPKLWSPESPFLYDLQVTLEGGETVRGYTGIRWCERKKDDAGINRFFLNGHEVFMLGPLDQGWWPDGLLTPPSNEAMRHDLLFLKQAGFNCLRKHIKVENALFYRACDELGLMVWQDFPNGKADTEDSRVEIKREDEVLIRELRVFPSIVMWIVFNETWGQFDYEGTRQLTAWTKELDPTRLVSNATGWLDCQCGDLVDTHRYPGPGMPALDPGRIAVNGEFGGVALAIPGHLWVDDGKTGNPKVLADTYQRLINDLKPFKARGLAGAIYTQITDVENERNGLMTYDRQVNKIPLEKLAEMNHQILEPLPPVRDIAKTSELEPVLWKATEQQPGGGWMKPEFDDSAWEQKPGGFGKLTDANTPHSGRLRFASGMGQVRTTWISPDLWLRRTFDYDGTAVGSPAIVIYCHDTAEVWLNGKPLATFQRNNFRTNTDGGYMIVPLEKLPLQSGQNLLAVKAERASDEVQQYFDAGLVDMVQPYKAPER